MGRKNENCEQWKKIGVNPSLTITALAEYAMDKIPFGEGHFPNDLSQKLAQLEKEWIAKKLI